MVLHLLRSRAFDEEWKDVKGILWRINIEADIIFACNAPLLTYGPLPGWDTFAARFLNGYRQFIVMHRSPCRFRYSAPFVWKPRSACHPPSFHQGTLFAGTKAFTWINQGSTVEFTAISLVSSAQRISVLNPKQQSVIDIHWENRVRRIGKLKGLSAIKNKGFF